MTVIKRSKNIIFHQLAPRNTSRQFFFLPHGAPGGGVNGAIAALCPHLAPHYI
ncbi:hypothetical protein HanHA300_Chr03g0102701 [Helianthus annuus]|nr:hypothetical protein HanHA300_Chr03g0102701 [Helianthus annuus]KAJ0608932.1 hypothetical protein HanHA89_Chr03g0114381 [Helianthus annuus]